MTGILGLSAALVSRGLAALGGFLLSLVVARLFGPAVLGQFTIFLTATGLAAIFAKRGYDMLMLRNTAWFAGEESPFPARQILLFSLRRIWWSVSLSALVGAGILYSGVLGESLPGSSWAFLLTVPLMTVLAMVSAYFKGVDRAWIAPVFEIGGISLVAAGVLWLSGVAGYGEGVPAAAPHLALVIAMLGVFCASLLFLPKQDVAQDSISLSEPRLWLGQADFTVIAFSTFLVQSGAILIAAPFLDNETVGLLRAAERFALLVSFASLAIRPFIAPRVVRYIQAGSRVGLKRLMIKAMIASGVVGFVPLSGLLIVPERALSLMGPEFASATSYLVPMALMNYLILLTAPFAMMLNMSGWERVSMWINVSSLGISAVTVPLFSYELGGAGFLLAYLISLSVRQFLISATGFLVLSKGDGKHRLSKQR